MPRILFHYNIPTLAIPHFSHLIPISVLVSGSFSCVSVPIRCCSDGLFCPLCGKQAAPSHLYIIYITFFFSSQIRTTNATLLDHCILPTLSCFHSMARYACSMFQSTYLRNPPFYLLPINDLPRIHSVDCLNVSRFIPCPCKKEPLGNLGSFPTQIP